MEPRDAQAALNESARRRRQTVQAGTEPWSWSLVLSAAATLVAIGIATDLEMIWLYAVVIVASWGIVKTNGVRLRRTRASRGWGAALTATFLLALLADIAVQFVVRGEDMAAPNTWGAAAAALTIIAISRQVHARMAASLRP